MPQFHYRGRNRNGLLTEGTLEAANVDAMANRLRDEQIIPLAIKEADFAPVNTDTSTRKRRWWKRDRVQLPDVIMFSRQMYSLTKSGVPIIRAIMGLADTTARQDLRDALHKISEDLQSGVELAAAMGRHPDIFSMLYISLIHVGENTGRLDLAFDQCSKYLEMELLTRNRIKEAVRYPVIVLTAMAIAIIIINVFVIPAFAGLFASFKGTLPLPTRIIMATSHFFVVFWPYLLAATVGGSFALLRWKKTEAGQLKWDTWKIGWPLVGSILYRATLARFARSFASCQRAGVPISTALGVVANAVDNAFVGMHIRHMREGIERGESISRTAQHTGMFSPLVMQMLQVGEDTGQVDRLLDEVGEFYEREVDYDLKGLAAAIEPILIVGLGIMVLVLALGIFLPMWQIASIARGG